MDATPLRWCGRGAPRRGAVGIPVYDVQKVGYPQRMRDHDARLASSAATRREKSCNRSATSCNREVP